MTTETTAKPLPKRRDGHKTLVLKSAIFSRLLLLSLSILWRLLLSPYDTSATLNPACLADPNPNPRPPPFFISLGSAIENGIVWDSVSFVRIAQCGYEYEQSYAFLPLLPACVFILSRTVFAPLVPLFGHRAILGLSGYIVSNGTFVLAAIYFYNYYFEGPCFCTEGFDSVLLQSSFDILLINIFRELVCPIFSWWIVSFNLWCK